ncbi:MAG: hypothetical protein AAGC92_16945 [Pseudomonadota bacterium]
MVGHWIFAAPSFALRSLDILVALLLASLKTLAAAVFCTVLFAALGGLGLALATAAWRDRAEDRARPAPQKSA